MSRYNRWHVDMQIIRRNSGALTPRPRYEMWATLIGGVLAQESVIARSK